MTLAQTAQREAEVKDGIPSAVQNYLASLAYLRAEAKRDGLDAIAEIIWEALAAIETWLDTGNTSATSSRVLDSSLCHSLEFLLKWLSLPPDGQRHIAQNIARYEAEPIASETLPRSRHRVSKTMAD